MQEGAGALFERGRRDVNGHVKQTRLPAEQRLDDAAGLGSAAAAEFEERDGGAPRGRLGDLARAAREDFAFGARQVVFGEPADGLEELRAEVVVEVFRGQKLLLRREAEAHVAGKVLAGLFAREDVDAQARAVVVA